MTCARAAIAPLLALALSACPARPAPPPATPVANEAGETPPPSWPADLEQACLDAVTSADAPFDDGAAHALQLDDHQILCVVEARRDTATALTPGDFHDVDVMAGVLSWLPDGPRLGRTASWTLTEGESLDDGMSYEERVEIRVEAIELRDAETAAALTIESQSSGPQHAERTIDEWIYRAVDGELVPVFHASARSITGEADHVEERTVTLADTYTGGFRDLIVTVHRREIEWASGGHCPIEYTIDERWTWDGDAYQLTDAEEPPEDDCVPPGDDE